MDYLPAPVLRKPVTIEQDFTHQGCMNCDGDGRVMQDHDGRVGYARCREREIRCPACFAYPAHTSTCATRNMSPDELRAFQALPWKLAKTSAPVPMAQLVLSADGKTVNVGSAPPVARDETPRESARFPDPNADDIAAAVATREWDEKQRARPSEPATMEPVMVPEPATETTTPERSAAFGAFLDATLYERAQPSEPAPTRPGGAYNPTMYPIPETHVNPSSVDGDVRSLGTRVLTAQAEIGALAAEALRVRDQHAARIDALNRELLQVKIDRDDARKDYAALALKYRQLEEEYAGFQREARRRG